MLDISTSIGFLEIVPTPVLFNNAAFVAIPTLLRGTSGRKIVCWMFGGCVLCWIGAGVGI